MKIFFRVASVDEGEILADLALRSKSYWKYPFDYLSRCRPALLMDRDYILNWPVMVLEIDDVKVGFYSLKRTQDEDRLDQLWVDLPYIGKGYGKRMFLDAILKAQERGWKKFRLAADPGAQGFYEKFGCNKIGMIQSQVKSDLFLPHMELIF